MKPLFVIASILSLLSQANGDCYFPNGGTAGADVICLPNALVSHCCFKGQACLSNGLCVSDPHNETEARFHRGTCTDKSWQSGNCPRHCTDVVNNGAPVYSCNATGVDSYCCADNCQCNSQYEVFSFAEAQPYTITIIGESYTNTHTSTSPSSPTATSASLSASAQITTAFASAPLQSNAPTGTAVPSSSSNNNSSSGTAIGVGVGVGVGGAALIGAAAFFFWYRRRDGKRNAASTTENPFEAPNNEYFPPSELHKYSHNGSPVISPSSHSIPLPRHELPTNYSHDPIELENTTPKPGQAFHKY